MQPHDPPDLNALASSAHQQIRHREGRVGDEGTSALPRPPWRRYLAPGLIWLCVAVAVLLDFGGVRTRTFGLPASALRAEAVSVLTAAKAAVDSHRSTTGQLPERVPLAALDALVEMERTASGYRLSVRGREPVIQIDEAGQITER